MYNNRLLRHSLVTAALALLCGLQVAAELPSGLKVKNTQIEQSETQLVLGTVFDVSGSPT